MFCPRCGVALSRAIELCSGCGVDLRPLLATGFLNGPIGPAPSGTGPGRGTLSGGWIVRRPRRHHVSPDAPHLADGGATVEGALGIAGAGRAARAVLPVAPEMLDSDVTRLGAGAARTETDEGSLDALAGGVSSAGGGSSRPSGLPWRRRSRPRPHGHPGGRAGDRQDAHRDGADHVCPAAEVPGAVGPLLRNGRRAAVLAVRAGPARLRPRARARGAPARARQHRRGPGRDPARAREPARPGAAARRRAGPGAFPAVRFGHRVPARGVGRPADPARPRRPPLGRRRHARPAGVPGPGAGGRAVCSCWARTATSS